MKPEQKKALQESEERYRTMAEWSPEPILIHRLGKILYVNSAAINLFGASHAHDLVGTFTGDRIHPACLDAQMERMRNINAKIPIAHMVESRFLKLDGSVIDVEVQGTSIVYDGEDAIHVSVRDITVRKQSEEKLRLAASVFTHAHEGIMITAVDGAIVDVNDAFTRITGYSREEALGRNPRALHTGRQEKEGFVAMTSELVEKGYWSGEIWSRHKNGEAYALMQTISAVCDDAGVVRHYVALFSDITARKHTEDQVRLLAFYDPLTQLPNRHLLRDRLTQAMVASKRNGCYGAVMILDLDNFKSLNDTHGHLVGDLLLVEAAKRLIACVRETDTVARFGGDEFVVMLNGLHTDKAASLSQASVVAENICARLSERYVLTLPRDSGMDAGADMTVVHQCSASIGVVVFVGYEASQDDVLKWADAAMYQAKGAGRNLVRFHR